MALELIGLLLANVGYLVVGLAAFAAAGWVSPGRPHTWRRVGAAYMFGIVIVVVSASYLALVHVPVGVTALVVGAGVVVFGAVRAGLTRPPHVPRIRIGSLDARVGLGVTVVALVVLGYAARTFMVRPLIEYDAWAIWAPKARLLYENIAEAPEVLRTGQYGQSPYPLALPTLQALGFDAMGRFDSALIGVQFLALAFGFVAALWSVLDRRARPSAIALATTAIVVAPQILFQLLTHYADVPLALFVGLGVVAAAAWTALPDRDGWLLGCSVGFLAMAGLTKSEGLLFAFAAATTLLVAQTGGDWRTRWRPALVAVTALVALVLPWRLYCIKYNLATPDYDLKNITNVAYLDEHRDRVGPIVRELWHQLHNARAWGLLLPATAVAILAGLAGRRWRVTAFAACWLLLAFGGLVLVYWVSTLPTTSNLTNSSFRTIVSLLVGGTAMLPLLIAPLRPEADVRTSAAAPAGPG